jgi:endonuclease/exonuclease/phosphatase family metal-dependent hydrolase
MKLLTWNVNHRTHPRPIPDLVPDAIEALAPDLLVLTEYVRGPSHPSFLSRLAGLGLGHTLISPETRGQNSVMIASRRPLAPGCISAPPIAPALPYNFLHVELPEDGFQVMGIRIPDYSRQSRIRKVCWDWLCSLAAEVVSSPTVMIGDFNSDPNYSKSRCGDRFAQLVTDGWQLALPEDGASYWSPNNHAVRLDHAFVSKDYRIISARYVESVGNLILANRRRQTLPDHAALEIVIENARDSVYFACRRLLDMVQVLHRQGYELLRINPGMSPSGCHWRCELVPAVMTVQGHHSPDVRDWVETAYYSSGQETNYFEWADAVSDSPVELASKFVERFPEFSKACIGKDPEYVNWYSSMLEKTAPDGIIYAYADYPVPEDYLPVQNKPEIRIPFPPQRTFRV